MLRIVAFTPNCKTGPSRELFEDSLDDAARLVAERGNDNAGAGVSWVRCVAGIGLDDDNLRDVAGDDRTGLGYAAGNEDAHKGRQRGWRMAAVAWPGLPSAAARRRCCASAGGEALEAIRCGTAGEGVQARPTGAPEGDRSAITAVVVADDENAARGKSDFLSLRCSRNRFL